MINLGIGALILAIWIITLFLGKDIGLSMLLFTAPFVYFFIHLLEKNNKLDPYEDRKEFKSKRYRKLREKYEVNETNKYNARFLLSMLAVREVDDDWWPAPACGSCGQTSQIPVPAVSAIPLMKTSQVLFHP